MLCTNRQQLSTAWMMEQDIPGEIELLQRNVQYAEETKNDELMCAIGDHIRRKHAPFIGQVVGVMKRYFAVQRPDTKLDMPGIMTRLYQEFKPLHEVTKNLIFLDIDGVLINARCSLTTGWYPVTAQTFLTKPAYTVSMLDHYAMGFLRNLCEVTDAKVSLCSTWRTSFDDEELQAFQHYTGLPLVPSTENKGHERPTEILHYLMNNPAVEKACIIDDENYSINMKRHDAVIWQHPINSNEGIKFSQMASICEFFGVKSFDLSRLAKQQKKQ